MRTPRWGISLTVILALALSLAPGSAAAKPRFWFEVRSLDGSENNLAHPTWGQAGTSYQRLAPAHYADGVGAMVNGPNPRRISNRVFNSLGVDLFSERNVSQWAWVWGQFLDHTFGLAQEGSEDASIPLRSTDPLESYHDDVPAIAFTRDAVAPGTGTGPSNPRQQVNTVNSYIDAWTVYGGTWPRLHWLRTGADHGNPHAGAQLMLPGGYLPLAGARGDAGAAPPMQTGGQLTVDPQNAVVAGDVRANENAELTSVQTLFAREHNRIVSLLPKNLSDEQRFQIARHVVGAEEQYITYTEFLPSLGVTLDRYRGYKPSVDAELYDEFATVGYRAHSMINGEEHIVVTSTRYTPAQLDALRAMGVAVTPLSANRLELTVSQSVAFFNPALVPAVGLGPMLAGLADEPGYKNDEQIDESLRSVLFEFPGPGTSDPQGCFAEPTTAGCYQGVEDLAAIDVQRSRDHGIPTYNQLRKAVGLPPQTSFTQITGESTDQFPARFGSDPIDNPAILGFTSLKDLFGRPIAPGDTSTRAVYATRASTLAARLRAIYGSVDNVDAFVGMMSEPHVPGTEFGELQLALWKKQFQALRDGDRFFYLADPALAEIQRRFGISYRHTLAQLIALDTDVPPSSLRGQRVLRARAGQGVTTMSRPDHDRGRIPYLRAEFARSRTPSRVPPHGGSGIERDRGDQRPPPRLVPTSYWSCVTVPVWLIAGSR